MKGFQVTPDNFDDENASPTPMSMKTTPTLKNAEVSSDDSALKSGDSTSKPTEGKYGSPSTPPPAVLKYSEAPGRHTPPYGNPNAGGTPYGNPNAGGTPYGNPNAGGTPYGNPNAGGTPYGNPNAGGTPYGNPNVGGTPYGNPNAGGTPYGNPNAGGTPYGNPNAGEMPYVPASGHATAAPKSKRIIGKKTAICAGIVCIAVVAIVVVIILFGGGNSAESAAKGLVECIFESHNADKAMKYLSDYAKENTNIEYDCSLAESIGSCSVGDVSVTEYSSNDEEYQDLLEDYREKCPEAKVSGFAKSTVTLTVKVYGSSHDAKVEVICVKENGKWLVMRYEIW